MPKQTYRVRNWKEYNKSLVKRGSVTLWFDEDALANWYELAKPGVKQAKGRPKKYSDTAVQVMLILKQVYRLTLRSCQGFVESLFKLNRLSLEVISYSRLCRRAGIVSLPAFPKGRESIHLVIDSTGLKLYGEGEWKVRQHGWTKHRMWRKLHVGVDEKSRLVVCALLTKNDCGDDKKVPELLAQYPGAIHKASLDGAYDSHACHDAFRQRGALALIPPQPNPKHKPKRPEDITRPRDELVFRLQTIGREAWKKESGYHRRSLVENAIYRYKQLLGDKLASRKLENQQVEALLKCHILNTLTQLGMPHSVPLN